MRTAVFPLALLLTMASRAAERQVLTGHRPAVVAHLQPMGNVPALTRMAISIGLPLRNRQGLTNLLQQLYDPESPNYHHYLTPGQFTAQYGPTEQDYQKLAAFVEGQGLKVTGRHPNRLLLDVSGSAAEAEKAFHVKMLVYQHPTEARTFYAPDVEPSLDLDVPVLRIAGLDNYMTPRPANLGAVPDGGPAGPAPNAGTGPGGSYQGNDFRAAYLPDVTNTGSGQALGLLELDGYYPNDIADYESRAGLPNVTVTNVLLDGFLGTPGAYNFEVALDIELALAMAPGLSELIVYEAGSEGTVDSVLSRMAEDNLAKQLSSSWLWNPGDDPTADQIFQQFAAQGQSFFTAAGDVDAYTGAIPFPADNPFITVVGATSLSTTSGGAWSSETVWNFNNGQGGGGGISTTYTIPTWQQGMNMTINGGSTTYRNLPDVAIVGYNVSIIYDDGVTNAFYGTSCSAPLWAAVVALANQQAGDYGQPAVGFINPAIYGLGQATNYLSCFHDITTGNNTNSGSPTQFFACPGYDLCTGWGTPASQALINALAPPSYLVISPAAGLTATGLPGGPFTPSSQSCYVSNFGPVTLSWSLANTAAWLNVSASSGTLPAGGIATPVSLSFNSAANDLASGAYSTALAFTDGNTGLTRTLPFTLQVSRSVLTNGGFETGSFSSWSLTGNTSDNVVTTSLVTPHSGEYAAAFGQAGSLAYLSQTVSTTAGQAYLLSFWLSNPKAGTPNQFVVNWNTNLSSTNTILSQTNLGPFNWTNEQFIVTAAGTSSVLQFGFRDDPQYLGLDDVSLIPLQPPVAGNLVLQRGQNCGAKVRAASLLAGGSDPNNGALTLVSAGPASTNGGTVAVSGNWISYTPLPGFTNSDAFTYVIADSDGLQATGTVLINVPVNLAQSQNIVAIEDLGNNSSLIQFQGIAGRTYTIQYTESLQTPVWQTLGTSTADATGAFEFTDTAAGGSRYYRSTNP
ncbi:MAG: protease pro-enzyme activation domain-containing protein [Verrucomicrobiota bacterium]